MSWPSLSSPQNGVVITAKDWNGDMDLPVGMLGVSLTALMESQLDAEEQVVRDRVLQRLHELEDAGFIEGAEETALAATPPVRRAISFDRHLGGSQD